MEFMIIAIGVAVCSILGMVAVSRNGGELLKKISVRYLCQLYLVLVAAMQLYMSHDTILQQTMGLVLFGLGAVPLFISEKQLPFMRGVFLLGFVLAPLMIFFI